MLYAYDNYIRTHKESISAINSQMEGRVVEVEAPGIGVLDSTNVISAIVSLGQL